MTNEEARKVCAIAHQADGGCPSCVEDQLKLLRFLFPEIEWDKLEALQIPEEAWDD
jgi:hypothetical protein